MAKQKNSQNFNRIGLALSGGGFRASLYHLGTIRYLEEVGIMERVEAVSTVSGGSIIGAYYLVEMEKMLRVNPKRNRLEACDQIIKQFSDEIKHNFRMRAVVFFPFYHPIQTLLRILKIKHPGDTMAKAFEKILFATNLRIGSLPVQCFSKNQKLSESSYVKGSRMLINATSLISGKRVVFSRENETGIKSQIHKSDNNSHVLARVVGASAAVPGLFRPLKIGNEILCDGGVVDNQGLESLFDYFEISDESLNLLKPSFRQPQSLREEVNSKSDQKKKMIKPKGEITFIISDGAGQFSVKSIPSTQIGGATRSMEVLQAANRRKVLKMLVDNKDREQIKSFAFTHLAMNLKGRENISERLPTEYIVPTAELRTDLDDFSLLEREALIYHAYTLMKAQIETHTSLLIDSSKTKAPSSNKDWPPEFIKLSIPKSESDKDAAEKTRSEVSRFLSIGSSMFFRDVQRFKTFFAPILSLFMIISFFSARCLLKTTSIGENISKWITTAISNFIPDWQWLDYFGLLYLKKSIIDDNFFPIFSNLFIYALSFYIFLWLYWALKARLKLPEMMERKLLSKLKETFLKKEDSRD